MNIVWKFGSYLKENKTLFHYQDFYVSDLWEHNLYQLSNLYETQ
jgi:hypothetical protein